jgi:hypothetical protein
MSSVASTKPYVSIDSLEPKHFHYLMWICSSRVNCANWDVVVSWTVWISGHFCRNHRISGQNIVRRLYFDLF